MVRSPKGYFVIALDTAFLHELLDDVRIGTKRLFVRCDEQQNACFPLLSGLNA